MSAFALIRVVSLAGIALNLRGGQLFAGLPADPSPHLVASIRTHKPSIVAALDFLATNATIRDLNASRPDVGSLTDTGREEAATLAADLARAGGLGQFVNDLFHTWNDLTPADRATACHVWQLAAGATLERAA